MDKSTKKAKKELRYTLERILENSKARLVQVISEIDEKERERDQLYEDIIDLETTLGASV
jgi:uncharacterized protein Yka (UPF0111/DUF47 family)